MGNKAKWMDLGCDLEGDLTGSPSGLIREGGDKEFSWLFDLSTWLENRALY